MYVIATAGHVDHGKSALVRALTGIEPDRWTEEHQRGMTIDLGYAWTRLPSGADLAIVDVPGHERFVSNMLAGLGPLRAALFVVAADEGWRQQSAEHLAAADALGIEHGLLVVTRTDLADPRPALREARDALARTSLRDMPAVAVSALTGEGLSELRSRLDDLVGSLPPSDVEGPARLWVDRSFTIHGSGTVVTGTLSQGTVAVGDELLLNGRRVRVRGVQSLGKPRTRVKAVARVGLNLRNLPAGAVGRGDALVTPGGWRSISVLDVRMSADPRESAQEVMVHVGTAGVSARIRPLGADTARLTLRIPLPLTTGDRGILRNPGAHDSVQGFVVLDIDPPALTRRGAAAKWAQTLAQAPHRPDLQREVSRRGALHMADARELGVLRSGHEEPLPDGVIAYGDWLVSPEALAQWRQDLVQALAERAETEPLDPTLSVGAGRAAIHLPDPALMPLVLAGVDVEVIDGRLQAPGVVPSLGPAEHALRALEQRLATSPFAAPERGDLTNAGLGSREIAAAIRLGRLIRVGQAGRDDVVLLPLAPAQAMRVLAALPQPFTTSEARQALGTTRRVALPLLEHLDARGWTRRIDAGHRVVVR
ncbi:MULTISPECIES: selenocysteine-specific translation elongation factor [unclassified Rhodococcus (in: high G+C Gram-positive bacteria)]|uniref:selenocysteine-specific translation elongation factor n=1 Tax=unclassified Rhodococcus (in: high G+C Gram-positive bacteria) TaxID=192944 RepID=UPI00092AAB52|nr:selenocysteine-specific translation elongation factor [Rhodococcus sp. M8]OLL19223.1 selenocysteine-specific translation elongation factor [Rhodococcus sp. M8]QPG47912.1 selenocysteine-specific translation elongation factor [Rhodococcus sp. M8]